MCKASSKRSTSQVRRHTAFFRLRYALIWVGLALGPTALSAADLNEGRQLYERFCSRCHGEEGYRAIPQAPDLARGDGLMRSNRDLRARLKRGRGLCPSYQGLMRPREFTNLIVYIRTLR